MALKLDKRKVIDCPHRWMEWMKCQGRSINKARCRHPEHLGLCSYDGKTFLWRCKYGGLAEGAKNLGGDR